MRLDKNEFRTWLSSKEPEIEVGISCDPFACPIAKFSGQKFWPGEDSDLWARQFAYEVDRGGYRNITASRALKILDEVKS